MSFRTTTKVRFGDVDHAGIVYYPRFYIYFHEAFEDFFNSAGQAYHAMLDERRIGFPTVHVETDFSAPLRYGDSLDIQLSLARLSQRSAVFRFVGHRQRDNQPCVTALITTACIDMDTFRARDIPDDLRAAFEQHRETA